jgi:hypothetical protein
MAHGRVAVAALVALVATACGPGREAERADNIRGEGATAGGSAQAADQCLRDEPTPVLTATGPAAGRPRFERKGKLGAVEEVRLSDTTSLRITHGGCAHYVETYAFTVRGAVRDMADAKYWLGRAVGYLEGLNAVEDRRPQIDEMVKALQGAAGRPAPYAYGDPVRASEMALVWVTVRGAGRGAVVLEIVYDVAL